jgi:hypothetical protein
MTPVDGKLQPLRSVIKQVASAALASPRTTSTADDIQIKIAQVIRFCSLQAPLNYGISVLILSMVATFKQHFSVPSLHQSAVQAEQATLSTPPPVV